MPEIFVNIALIGDVWIIWILVVASILSLGVMVERAVVFGRNKGNVADLMDQMALALEQHDLPGACKLAEASNRVEGRVVATGLAGFAKGHAAVEEMMTSRWLREKLILERRLIILGTLGNNAPFIGLFGTVLGIIKAFNSLAVTGQSGVAVVMSGISMALIATAFGILVAIPAVVANNYFVTRLKEIQTNTDSLGRILLAYLKDEVRSNKTPDHSGRS